MVTLKKAGAGAVSIMAIVAAITYGASFFVLAQDYDQNQLAQMTRSDGFELRHVKEEITKLKRERRDVRDVLTNYPNDEDAHEEMDEIELELDEFEARKCFLMKRNEMEC